MNVRQMRDRDAFEREVIRQLAELGGEIRGTHGDVDGVNKRLDVLNGRTGKNSNAIAELERNHAASQAVNKKERDTEKSWGADSRLRVRHGRSPRWLGDAPRNRCNRANLREGARCASAAATAASSAARWPVALTKHSPASRVDAMRKAKRSAEVQTSSYKASGFVARQRECSNGFGTCQRCTDSDALIPDAVDV
jgi:hypothetical protein